MSRPGSIPLSRRPRLYGLYAIDSVYGELVPCSPPLVLGFWFFPWAMCSAFMAVFACEF